MGGLQVSSPKVWPPFLATQSLKNTLLPQRSDLGHTSSKGTGEASVWEVRLEGIFNMT